MAKDPAFLFYPGDWQGGTMYMTHEQKGAYMDLLILQFNVGKFTLAQAKQVLSICFDVAWPMLQHKFSTDGKVYWNQRLSDEVERRQKFTQSRRDNAKGQKKGKVNGKAYAKHMVQHMETENETINIKVNIESDIFSDEIFMSELQRMHKGKNIKEAWDQCWLYHSQLPSPPREGWEWRQKLGTWLTRFKSASRKTNYKVQ